MADLNKRLLQTYLTDTHYNRAELGVIRRPRQVKRKRIGLTLLCLGVAAAGITTWLVLRPKPAATEPTLEESSLPMSNPGPGTANQMVAPAPAAPPKKIPEPAKLSEASEALLSDARVGWQTFQNIQLRDALALVQETLKGCPGGPAVKVSENLEAEWANNLEAEPKVSFLMHGCTLLGQLRLLAAQAGLELGETAPGQIVLQRPEGLSKLPPGTWQQEVSTEDVAIWLRQQNGLRRLAFRELLTKAFASIDMGDLSEAKVLLEKLDLLAPKEASLELIRKAINPPQTVGAADPVTTPSEVGTEPLLTVPPLPGTQSLAITRPALLSNSQDLQEVQIQPQSLQMLLAMHGVAEAKQTWEAKGSLLNLSGEMRLPKTTQALLHALREASLPIFQIEGRHVIPDKVHGVGATTPTVHQNTTVQGIFTRRPNIAPVTSGKLPAGTDASLNAGTASQPISLCCVHQLGSNIIFDWSFQQDKTTTAGASELPTDELPTRGRSQLEPGQWLEIPDPTQPGASWWITFNQIKP